MCQQMTARLACTPSSIPIARSLILEQLDAWGIAPSDPGDERVSDILLAVSELVANAAKYGTNELGLLLVGHRDTITIAVTDDSPHPARLKQPGTLTPGGRGLTLVSAVSEKWGQRRHGRYKSVWARWSLPPGTRALGCVQAVK